LSANLAIRIRIFRVYVKIIIQPFQNFATIDSTGAHILNTLVALNQFNQEQPTLSHQLMIGFARELSKRIRIANRITTELKG